MSNDGDKGGRRVMSLEKSPLRVNPDRLVKGIMLKAESTVES